MLAVFLGLLAVAVDNLPLTGGRVLLVAVSTGLAWGGAAVLVGAFSQRATTAALQGLILLICAVAAYYGGIAVLGTRANVADGALSAAAAVWAAGAVVAGPVLGAIGWYTRNGSATQRPVGWGLLGGLLLSQGAYLAARSWSQGLVGEALGMWPVLGPLIVVPVVIVLIGARHDRLPLALAVMAAAAVLGGFAWSFLVSFL